VDVEQQAFEDLREAVRDAVEDETREAEAIRLVGQLEDDLAALRVQIADRKNTIRKLNADYDTPRSDFEAHLERVGTEVRENRQRVSSTQAALKGVITAEENEAISKAHTKAMQAAIVSIQTT
jgi:Mg2+ and Co2+ transporter CorA